jgi:hypothetical protein
VHRRHHVHHVRQEHEVRHPVVHAYIFAKQTRWVHIYSISFFRSCMPVVYTDLLCGYKLITTAREISFQIKQ